MINRLKIKKEILNVSQTLNSPIPLLSYTHIEIINPYYIDQTLLEQIDLENPNIPLTDELFFQCIEESPDYLAYECFRSKIKEWQDQLSELEDQNERKEIKNKLKKVGNALVSGFDDRGRKKTTQKKQTDFFIPIRYAKLISLFTPFLEENSKEAPSKQKKLFESEFPFWKSDDIPFKKSFRSPRELAISVLSAEFHMDHREIRRIISGK